MIRSEIPAVKRCIVKVGSALITADGAGLDLQAIDSWVQQLAKLHARGVELVLVSSGSIAEGMSRLGWAQKPSEVNKLQAAAAVGQMGLVQAYETAFKKHGIGTAQMLLTHGDMADRRRYLNARGALTTLLQLGVVPVVNENDTVTTAEIRVGDNDTLGALVANLVGADLLVILTDQIGLFDADPRTNPDAKLISSGEAGDPAYAKMAGPSGTAIGSGGMLTKVLAAEKAARSGTSTLIASGREPDVLLRAFDGEEVGTLLRADRAPLVARKQWLANQLQVRGRVVVDAGAVKVLRDSGSSLLPVGVVAVRGDFQRGELVAVETESGEEIARGLANYGSADVKQVIGLSTKAMPETLGQRMREPELIHRDNMTLTTSV